MASIDNIRDIRDNLKESVGRIDRDDILNALGLQSRRGGLDYVIPALGIFGAGLACGIGMGMLMAPKSGKQMRRELGRNIDRARDAIEEVARN